MIFTLFPQRTLLSRTLWPIAIVVILILAGTTAMISHNIHSVAYDNLTHKAELTVQTMANAVATPVWDVSVKEAEKLIRAIAPDTDFVEGTIYLDDGNIFARHTGRNIYSFNNLTVSQPIVRQGRNGLQNLGRLEIVYSVNDVDNQVLYATLHLVAGSFLLFLVVIGTLYLILQAVTRPIVQMTAAMEELSHGNIKTEIPYTPLGGELAAMANAMNVFKNNAAELYHLIEEQKKLRIAAEKNARISLFLKQTAATANRVSKTEDMLALFLATTCKLFHWPIGHIFQVDTEHNVLRSMKIWYLQDSKRYQVFRKATEETVFAPEMGLPGQAWSKQLPVWVENSKHITNSPRLALLDDAGPFSGVAFPVLIFSKVRYIVEFIAEGPKPLDRDLFSAFSEASAYLSMGLERKEKEKQILQAAVHGGEVVSGEQAAQGDTGNTYELKAPVHSVLGMLSLVLESELSETQHNRGDIAQQSTESLVSLINDILDMTPVDDGQFLVESKAFNLYEMTENAVRLYHTRAQQKGLAILLDIPPSVPPIIYGDFLCIRQILLNLLENAIKFTSKGYIVVRVQWIEAGEQTHLLVAIDDTGAGFDKKTLGCIMSDDTIVQGDCADATSIGLGLTVCKKLIRLIGGTMGGQSTEGEGTTFWFSVAAKSDRPAGVPPYRVEHPLMRQHTVLILDSYNIDTLVASWALAQWGIEALYVGDQKSFIKTAIEQRGKLSAVICPTNGIDSDLVDFLYNYVEDSRKNIWIGFVQPLGQSNPLPAKLRAKTTFILSPPLCPPTFHRLLTYIERHYSNSNPVTPVSLQALTNTEVATARATAQEQSASGKVSVLVVDDQSFNLILMDSLLSRNNCLVETASSGKTAIEKVRKKNYDLIFMDCQMPETDGFEATKIIRSLEATRGGHTPIIAFTANTSLDDRDKCIAYGMDDYISKPINYEKILYTIQKHAPKALASNDT